MKPTALIRLLSHAFRNRLKVLVVSAPGLGKSAIVTLERLDAIAHQLRESALEIHETTRDKSPDLTKPTP